jgi:hypothetical protein
MSRCLVPKISVRANSMEAKRLVPLHSSPTIEMMPRIPAF